MKSLFGVLMLIVMAGKIAGQQPERSGNARVPGGYWNSGLRILPYRLPPPPAAYTPEYLDLDKDGDPDVIQSVTANYIPIAWIDDDDDMKAGDLEGDTDSDCLLINRNRDGRYGALGDLIIDWIDTDRDNQADMQVVVEYPFTENENVWPHGHYMWMLDADRDHVFNYIDWNTFQLKAWELNGTSDFLEDYSGHTAFMKVHAATNRMEDITLNWENPFLFYDKDKDGLSEMAVRLANTPSYFNDSSKSYHPQTLRFSGKIDWASVSVDLDNDNGPGNEFDFDFSLGFRGEGFAYKDQVHRLTNARGLPAADSFFLDARWRQTEVLVYAGHENALDLIFSRGKWNKIYFVYDEDDDCHRWERVEFYDPLDPFKAGANKGGIDNHPQSDVAGDRGEWDMDNSGNGMLYVSRMDGRLHLYGAEWGCWRIDQNAYYYQGWDRSWLNKPIGKLATVRYEDKDKNGFFDYVAYDLDGDATFETTVDLKALGLDDRCDLIDVSTYSYKEFRHLQEKMSKDLMRGAQEAIRVAGKYQLNVGWYAKLFEAPTIQKKYQNGFWIQFYIFHDLLDLFSRKKDEAQIRKLFRAYYHSDWQSMRR